MFLCINTFWFSFNQVTLDFEGQGNLEIFGFAGMAATEAPESYYFVVVNTYIQ